MDNTITSIIQIDPNAPDESVLRTIADELERGKIIGFPTETVYGIGALSTQSEAIERIYAIKNRSKDKPLAVYVHDRASLDTLSIIKPPFFDTFIDQFLPGPITLICATEKGEKHGLRFSSNPVLNRLLSMTSGVMQGTSANMSGCRPLIAAGEVYAQFKEKIDYIIDTGHPTEGVASTVIDISQNPCILVREGTATPAIQAFFKKYCVVMNKKKKILIVCTGNTCRSPMVAAWLKSLLKEKKVDGFYDIDSCGVYAPFSIGASKDAVCILEDEGLDLSSHRSKSLTRVLAEEADKIVVMSSEHKQAVLGSFPVDPNKLLVLNIPDPIGKGKTYYEETFNAIKEKIAECIEWILE